ncbi:phage tail protein [Nitrospina gracilis]|uniref:phage tail protein n=1 Tax=Nitrospina gracilis TaxID=35801 RepID=UPI001F2C8311|nr:phage tail protein [Nitrospina gracilis]MCF8719204.1 alkaline phosphatase [Nitrospina gracilis Nb-211]
MFNLLSALLVTDAGLDHIAAAMSDSPETAMSHMAVGTGSIAAAAGDTTLETELSRIALTSKTASNNKVTYSATFGAGVATGALTEVGILNAASLGTLLTRIVFAVKNKGSNDTLQIDIEHTYARP